MNMQEKIFSLEKEVSKLKREVKATEFYAILFKTLAKYNGKPEVIIDALQRLDTAIKERDWNAVRRMAGACGDPETDGSCEVCGINLVGGKPRKSAMPCEVRIAKPVKDIKIDPQRNNQNCPYENQEVEL